MTVPPARKRPSPEPTADERHPLVCEEVKRIARHHLRAVNKGATLSTTELAHEAFPRLGHRPAHRRA